MSNFFIEFFWIHLSLTLVYFIFLKKENQYAFLRYYLLVATVLALIIPFLHLTDPFYVPKEVNIGTSPANENITEAIRLTTNKDHTWKTTLFYGSYAIISILFLVKLILNWLKIWAIARKSEITKMDNTSILKSEQIKGSFSFFNWIFIHEQSFENETSINAIISHEKAHTKLKHTYDLLYLEMLRVCFWWMPTVWLTIKEIKKIHEYQADEFALKECNLDQYSSILISSTLKTHGLSLASSFHDGLIFKRLNAMKTKKSNVSLWKLGAINIVLAVLVLVFACTESPKSKNVKEAETFTVVEQLPEYPGGIDAFYTYFGNEITYPSEARSAGTEGTVLLQFAIETDGSIDDIQVVNGVSDEIDQEAIRVLRGVEKFSPASQRGKKVRVQRQIPLQFKLNIEDGSAKGIVIIHEILNIDQQFEIVKNYEDGKLSGKIYDKRTGKALPGASIVIMGTTTGTVSDRDGSFELPAESSSEIAVSYVGYTTTKLLTRS